MSNRLSHAAPRRILLGVTIAAAISLLTGCDGGMRREISTRVITYDHDGVTLEGLYAAPLGAARHPAVLVCHEWWGNDEYSRGRAEDLARAGYAAFALDMYGQGKVSHDPNDAQQWSGEVYRNPKLLRERAAAGLKVLTSQPNVDAGHVAAIGYCFGGTVALELGRSGADLDAIVCFHTSKVSADNAEDNQNIKGYVMLCEGAADSLTRPEELAKFVQQFATIQKPYTLIAYGGAKHSFTNPIADQWKMPPVGYDKHADEASWAEMLRLFECALR